MKYYEINFNIQCAEDIKQTASDLLADSAGEAGCESFEETTNGLKAYAQTELWNNSIIDSAIANFLLPEVKITYSIKEADDKDWNKEWEDNGFEPINIENKVIICDAKKPLPESDDIMGATHVFIDAKLAFGTGTHETTRMIVATLLHMEMKDKRVLDCGCGTGILGLTASKLGAKNVIAYDIDEWSSENTKHNATINNVENIEAFQGDACILNHISGVFDVVMANINRNILLNDMPAFRSALAPGGKLIISGFYQNDIPTLLDKAKELGLNEFGRKNDGDWACLILK